MKHLLFLFITTLFICKMKASLVVIECTFPCPKEDNEDSICEVNNYFIKCKQRTNKTKWILKDITSLPEYQGTPVELGETCIFAPHPKLKDASHLSTNTSESVMDWPPTSAITTYDQYYSNCKESAYCNINNQCVDKLNYNDMCESDNQCLNGICIQNTCQKNHSKNPSQHTGLNTIHIILTVVGIVLFLSLLFGTCMFLRRRKRQQKQNVVKDVITVKPINMTPTASNHSLSAEEEASIHNNVTNILHPNYDPNFTLNNNTPSRQQQELQLQLQRQLQPNLSPPPPPYSP